MSTRHRLVRVLAAVLLAAACAACAATGPRTAPAGQEQWGPPTFDADGFPSDVPIELKVRHPKDARGIPVCDLLTPAQLRELGFDPATALPRKEGLAESCGWWTFHDPNKPTTIDYGGLGFSADPTAGKVSGFWRMFHDDPDFEMFEVAGHPVVRANLEPDRFCSLSVAVADLQSLVTNSSHKRIPTPDPCAGARRMAEMVLSNLPPLKR
jgi:hypothetical protein